MAAIDLKPLADAEAVQYFERKGYRFGFDWRDTVAAQHAGQFTVAKAMRLDILADIREAVDKAIREGRTRRQFAAELEPLLREKGWWGKKTMVDPKTGQEVEVQLGSPRRLRTIFDTNLRMAHAAGKWQRIQRLKESRPYLRMIAVLDGRTRPLHRQWHGTVLPVDDPWWDDHFPPNGWHCRCTVQQLSKRDMERWGYRVSDRAPDDGERVWLDKRNQVAVKVPAGIDPGFAHNAGKLARQFDPAAMKEIPVLDPVRTFRDHGRPAAMEVRDRPESPRRLLTLREMTGRGLSEEEARLRVEESYRRVFDILPDAEEAVVADPEGMGVTFNLGALRYLLSKGDGREAFLPLARATVEDPYEIWLVPFRKRDGRVVLRKRYIGLFDGDRDVLAVVERHQEGWGIWTAHPRDAIDTQRRGYLLFGKGAQ